MMVFFRDGVVGFPYTPICPKVMKENWGFVICNFQVRLPGYILATWVNIIKVGSLAPGPILPLALIPAHPPHLIQLQQDIIKAERMSGWALLAVMAFLRMTD